MKHFSTLSLMLFLLLGACSKKDDPEPIKNYNPQVAVNQSRIGLGHMVSNSGVLSITDAIPLASFTYEIIGANGVKKQGTSNISGTGQTDWNGAASINLETMGYLAYNDGELTYQIQFDSTKQVITTKALKEEFIIRNYQDFLNMVVSRGSDVTFKQGNDFAFPKDTIFTRCPGSDFWGTYDGQNYKITGLNIVAAPTEGTAWGSLFTSALGGTVIKNVQLELGSKGIVVSNARNIAGIVGWLENSSVINCSVKGNIESDSYASGVVGMCTNDGTIIGSSFTGTLKAPVVGGIVGAVWYSCTVRMCYSNCSIAGAAAGGIIGSISVGKAPDVTIENSYAHIVNVPESTVLGAIYRFDSSPSSYANVNYCYANKGAATTGTMIYNTVSVLNANLESIAVSGLPQGITPPANGKAYKPAADANAPHILWWQ